MVILLCNTDQSDISISVVIYRLPIVLVNKDYHVQ